MSSRSSAAPVASDSLNGKRGAKDTRAQWSEARTDFFVSILKEFNSPRYRDQNGWVKEGWNGMAQRMNEKFMSANFIVSQLKDREQRLKKDYNAVKLILSKSGFGWDSNLKMATTISEKWDELPENLQRWKDKSFPYYDDLDEIYNGKVAGGKHCRRSSEKTYKSEPDILEKTEHISTPSPTIPSVQSAWTDFLEEEQAYTYIGLNNDVPQSQYRAMVDEQAAREAYNYSQFSTSMETQTTLTAREPQTARDAGACSEPQTARDARACSEPQTAREAQTARDKSGSNKSKRNNDASMDELIALRREELEAYKALTERELQLKQRKLESSDPNNDPYSMAKCMAKLKTLSLPQADHLKAINFLKGDREAREIFMSCDEIDLADAFIKGSISN